MGHFYFIRHGQTVWNVANKICGATDIELTEKDISRQLRQDRKFCDRESTQMRSFILR